MIYVHHPPPLLKKGETKPKDRGAGHPKRDDATHDLRGVWIIRTLDLYIHFTKFIKSKLINSEKTLTDSNFWLQVILSGAWSHS